MAKSKGIEGRDSDLGDCYFTIVEVASRWKVSDRTVRRAIDCGDLKHPFRVGSRIRIPLDSVLDYETRFSFRR